MPWSIYYGFAEGSLPLMEVCFQSSTKQVNISLCLSHSIFLGFWYHPRIQHMSHGDIQTCILYFPIFFSSAYITTKKNPLLSLFQLGFIYLVSMCIGIINYTTFIMPFVLFLTFSIWLVRFKWYLLTPTNTYTWWFYFSFPFLSPTSPHFLTCILPVGQNICLYSTLWPMPLLLF